ncbi:MAG: oligoribonuclease [Spirochaetales bacterium]|nr:oligoribonuclease [Spirochaetales bacterium]
MIKQGKDNLVWVDLEFSGLDPLKNVILEIACIISDSQLNILHEGPVLAIHHDNTIIDAMDDWNTAHHRDSGLLDQVRESVETHESAENLVLEVVSQYCEIRTALLCGNSIHQDRYFINIHMPRLDQYLYYRNIDVSTIKEICRRWFPEVPEFEKKKGHRALDDIRESIDELKYYKDKIFNLKSDI